MTEEIMTESKTATTTHPEGEIATTTQPDGERRRACGYVALLGRPNAGKSTLMNSCVGQKVAIVSKKPQTTRNKILGIAIHENAQILFLDTPGLHKTQRTLEMNQRMNQLAWSATQEADLLCILLDVSQRSLHDEDKYLIENVLKNHKGKVLFLATKSDKLKKDLTQQNFETICDEFQQIKNDILKNSDANPQLISEMPILHSSKKADDVQALLKKMSQEMPESPWLYHEDDLTDKPVKFICAELIREQLFRQLGQELPYKMAVQIDKMTSDESKKTAHHIFASIIVERDSQKAIVIGKKGERLQSIGQMARESLETHFQKKVHLKLFVKVQPNWTHRPKLLQEFIGFEDRLDNDILESNSPKNK